LTLCIRNDFIDILSQKLVHSNSDRAAASAVGDFNGDGKRIFSLVVLRVKAAIYFQNATGFSKRLAEVKSSVF
jgi:hypothetical protein